MPKGQKNGPTVKQEAFARYYVETSNASEAYRRAYNAGTMAQNVIWVRAHEVLHNSKVSVMVKQLMAEGAKRHAITVDTITEMMIEDRLQAKELGQTAAAISANMGLAKIHGLIIEKRETTLKVTAEEMRDDELERIASTGRLGAVAPSKGSKELN